MKKITHPAFLLFVLTLFLGSCKKYLDLNESPNGAAEPPINGLLARVTYGSGLSTFRVSNITSYYVQYLAAPSNGSDLDTYNAIDPSSTWNYIYDLQTDLHDLRNLATTPEAPRPAYEAVAGLLTAYNLGLSINLWGNVPYSKAFEGQDAITPAYDDQKLLYDSCLLLLDKAIALLSDSANESTLDSKSDFIHAGDNAAWVRTAHQLKARWLNEVSKTSGYDAAAILDELAAGYTSSTDDAQISVFDGSGPWAEVAIANAGLELDGWLSSYFVNATNAVTYGVFDPRLPLITDKTKFGDYRGTKNGAGRIGTGTDQEESYLAEDGWYSKPGAPLQLTTYSEAKFIEAEAQFRSNHAAPAYDAYLAGIKANMERIGVSDTAITRYLAEPSVAVGAGDLTLKLIMKEKYVACFLLPVTWDDMRRFDYNYQAFALPADANLSQFIRRVDYPTVEISTNSANVPVVKLTDRLWWDQ